MSVYHFKILVPAAAAGRIIGKGGTTIAQLQRDAGARVKMSKASEFYPGTTERVCLISGPIEGILKINDFFMENFSSTSIKILVPNSTAGMIIGKSGNYIKQIKEESGAYVQISQKCTDLALPERCVTIVGDLDSIRKACAMILSKIVEDAGTTTSNNYRDIRTSSLTLNNNNINNNSNGNGTPNHQTSPHLNAAPGSNSITSTTPSNHLNHHNNHHQLHHTHHTHLISSSTPSISPVAPLLAPATVTPASQLAATVSATPIAPIAAATSPLPTTTTTTTTTTTQQVRAASVSPIVVPKNHVATDMNSDQIIESIKLVLRVSGYREDAVSEITSAMSTLASYGVLGVGLGLL